MLAESRPLKNHPHQATVKWTVVMKKEASTRTLQKILLSPIPLMFIEQMTSILKNRDTYNIYVPAKSNKAVPIRHIIVALEGTLKPILLEVFIGTTTASLYPLDAAKQGHVLYYSLGGWVLALVGFSSETSQLILMPQASDHGNRWLRVPTLQLFRR